MDYLRDGIREGQNPNPYFDTAWYVRQAGDAPSAVTNPLRHYLEAGADQGVDPSPIFDSEWYRRRNPDIAGTGMLPLEHFLLHGRAEGRPAHLMEARATGPSQMPKSLPDADPPTETTRRRRWMAEEKA